MNNSVDSTSTHGTTHAAPMLRVLLLLGLGRARPVRANGCFSDFNGRPGRISSRVRSSVAADDLLLVVMVLHGVAGVRMISVVEDDENEAMIV